MPPSRFFDEQSLGSPVLRTAGVINQDTGIQPEANLKLSWPVDPAISWIDYNCWIEVLLDSGFVLHKPLPQNPISPGQGQPWDTLASAFVDSPDGGASATTGVNTASKGGYTDVIQRMATSEYRFTLKGYGLRLGYQVPVPGIRTIAGVPAVPERQWSSGNVLVANYMGIPVWRNRWALAYLVALPPRAQQLPPNNLAQHIRADQQLSSSLTVPWSQPDSRSVPFNPVLRTRGGPPARIGPGVVRR